MWQDVKSELRDVCTSQPQPLGKKYLFSWAARFQLLWATRRGAGQTIYSINFNLTLRNRQYLESISSNKEDVWQIFECVVFIIQRSRRHNAQTSYYSPHTQSNWVKFTDAASNIYERKKKEKYNFMRDKSWTLI